MTEIYSEEGNRIEKSMYDYHSGRMISLRMYSNTGADVKKLEFAEYTNMKADSCNKQLDSGKGRYTDNQNKLSVRWKKGEEWMHDFPLFLGFTMTLPMHSFR